MRFALHTRHLCDAPAGRLFLATDNAACFGEILALLGPCPLFQPCPELARQEALPPAEAFGPTNFEVKYRAQGRTIHRAVWRRAAAPGPDPPESSPNQE